MHTDIEHVTAEPSAPRVPTVSRGPVTLAVKLGLVVFGAMTALAVLATLVFTNRLEDTYRQAGKSQLQALAKTWNDGFKVTSLENPAYLQRRIARLRQLTDETVHKMAVSWRDPSGATLLVQDGHIHDPKGVKRSVTTSRVLRVEGANTRAPIEEGPQPYREVRSADGAHFGELLYAVRRGHTTRAVVELHYDLKSLDQALAADKRTVLTIAVLAALTLTLLANLLLNRALLSPLNRLRSATERLGAGDRKHRLEWNRRDEIGLLARDFDSMAAELDTVHEHLEALALTDPLTGLLNHRAFKERLEQELRRAEREGYSVAVVALDVDNFKQVNDTWGHAAGDEGLQWVARSFRVHVRPSDICGRVGGDEFCVAIVRSTAEMAEEVVERLRAHVAKLELGPAGQSFTISAGVAEFPRHSLAREELMHLADGAMYWAKSSGRNRTCLYSADSGFALSAEEQAADAVREGLVNTVHALAKAVDAKDGYTSMHSQRVGRYAAALARKLGLDEEQIDKIRTAGVLHDVGKIGISDAILQKAATLDGDEWAIMRRHSELGHDIIAGASMHDIADFVLHLHERWDGAGYPTGLAGEDIPLASRILHVADALEAMTSSRVYRDGMPVAQALVELELCCGDQVDPIVTRALIELVNSGDLEVIGDDMTDEESEAAGVRAHTSGVSAQL
jgi:diguanylate cyclase (GGDEF)-like protein